MRLAAPHAPRRCAMLTHLDSIRPLPDIDNNGSVVDAPDRWPDDPSLHARPLQVARRGCRRRRPGLPRDATAIMNYLVTITPTRYDR